MIPSFTSENANTARSRERDVGASDKADAAAERVALDLSDDRRRARVDRLQHAAESGGVRHVGVVVEVDRGAHPLDVGPRRSSALAGQDDRARLPDVDEGLGELGDQRRVEGVPRLRSRRVTRRTSPSRVTRSALIASQLKVTAMLRGALAASVTPLRDEGAVLDEDGFDSVVDDLVGGARWNPRLRHQRGGRAAQRRGAPPRPGAVPGRGRRRLLVAAHCGAQATADTVALAAHAAAAGASAVAVIAPPYYPLDERAQLAHFGGRARVRPVPFYVYEFERTSGYAVPPGDRPTRRGGSTSPA